MNEDTEQENIIKPGAGMKENTFNNADINLKDKDFQNVEEFDKAVKDIFNKALSNNHLEETKPDDPMDISLTSVLKTFEETGGTFTASSLFVPSGNDEDDADDDPEPVDKMSMMLIQDGEFRCLVCDKTFAKKGQLSAHVDIHTGLRPFRCEICQKTFNKLYSLQRHAKIHVGLRPFSCRVCGKTFMDQASLKRHEFTHTGAQPFKCEICDTAFTVIGNLRRHMNLHTGERPHECELCGKKFIAKGNMKRHMLTHTNERPFPCQQCGDTFAQQAALKRHMLVHTGERPHECDVCKKTFATTSHLKRHINSHLGIRPFSCKVCFRLFTTSSNLKRHMHLHKGDLPKLENNSPDDLTEMDLEEVTEKDLSEVIEKDLNDVQQDGIDNSNGVINDSVEGANNVDGVNTFQDKISMLLSAHAVTEGSGDETAAGSSTAKWQPVANGIDSQHHDFITSFLSSVQMPQHDAVDIPEQTHTTDTTVLLQHGLTQSPGQ